jgi:tetratricopeptide (TPR) repeat protein
LAATGEAKEARSVLEQAVASYERLYPEGHRDLATAWLYLGDTAMHEGGAEEAGSSYRRALTLRRQKLDPDHWRIAEAQGRVGALLAADGASAEAEETLREALEKLESVVGASHPSTVRTRRALQYLGP